MKAITLPQICKEKNSKLAGCMDLYIFVMFLIITHEGNTIYLTCFTKR